MISIFCQAGEKQKHPDWHRCRRPLADLIGTLQAVEASQLAIRISVDSLRLSDPEKFLHYNRCKKESQQILMSDIYSVSSPGIDFRCRKFSAAGDLLDWDSRRN